jgi:hypothetical protein
MKGLRLAGLAGVLAVVALLAASASASGTAQAQSATRQAGEAPGTVQVKFVIDRFVRQGRRIVAKGAVVSRYQSATAAPVVTRKAFTARLATRRVGFSSTTRICNVLSLSIGPLDLNLLGLMIHLSGAEPTDPVVLTIKADSNGGLLGSLFCSLAGGTQAATPAQLRSTAARMTRAARAKGLQNGISGFRFQIAPAQAQPGQICTILDLTLGPLDLNLLGLMVHLDPVHLLITAQRGGGILGDLLCGLAGGTPVPVRAVPSG